MSRSARATSMFDLLGLIVVAALLLAVLLPSLGRARGTAMTVRCASNLKQLYTGIVLHCAMHDDQMLPALLNNGDSPNDRWYGPAGLGAMFGITDPPKANAVAEAQIKKMLDCPSVNHPPGWGPIAEGGNGKWGFDYTYNETMGSNSAAPGAPPNLKYPNPSRRDVRRETLLVTDVRDSTNVHDYVFDEVTPMLVPTSATNTADRQAIAGTPHNQGGSGYTRTAGNMLFADGQIITDDINKLMGPPPRTWVVLWSTPQTDAFPF